MGETTFVRKQYHFWPAERAFDAWDVDRLITLSRDLPIEQVAVDSIREVDTEYWFRRERRGPHGSQGRRGGRGVSEGCIDPRIAITMTRAGEPSVECAESGVRASGGLYLPFCTADSGRSLVMLGG
jgi:hypothetical protein